MSKILTCLFVLILAISPLLSKSQRYDFGDSWSTGLSFGTTSFFGDVTNKRSGFLKSTPFSKYFYDDRKWMFGAYLQKELSPYFGIRTDIHFGTLKSTKDAYNIYFNSTILEYSLSGTINISNIAFGQDRNRKWKLDGFVGIGLSESHTWKYNLKTDSLLLSTPGSYTGGLATMTEGIGQFGFMFDYKLNKQVSVYFEYSRFYINSDKLDAYIYDGQKFEGFNYMSLGVSYKFNMPVHWRLGGGNYRYDGKSNDPSIKAYNKQKRVVMKTKSYNKNKKKRYKNGSTLKRKRPKK